MDHRVHHLAVAEAHALARLRQQVGAFDIDSMPPATTISASPALMAWAASITAFRPEPQTLLMVRAATPWAAARP